MDSDTEAAYDAINEKSQLLRSTDDHIFSHQLSRASLISNGSIKSSSKYYLNASKRGDPAGFGRERQMSYSETVEQITLTFNNINVYIPPETKKCCRSSKVSYYQMPKQILNSVSGVVKPGQLLAILGARFLLGRARQDIVAMLGQRGRMLMQDNDGGHWFCHRLLYIGGAGKSTLLNVLTYRNRGSLIVDGEVLVNGQELGRGMTSISAYVQQDDLFIGTLKVREHLWFQAMVRMDAEIPYDDRMQRIEEVILELGLKKCADTIIGIPGRTKGCSGGEMKRLAFASEVLTNPPLMFCDEPTSGLDSFMAENVVHTLKNMAANGKTIICTIHQPSSQTYALFDQLMLMAEGRVAYLGPAVNAMEYFNQCGYPCPHNFNPADHYVHTLAIIPGQEQICKDRVSAICDKYETTDQYKYVRREIDKACHTTTEADLETAILLAEMSPYKSSWFTQFYALIWRCWISNARDSSVTNVRFLQAAFIALIIGLIYMDQTYDQKGVQNVNGALFLFLTNMTFSNVFAVINAFPMEMPIFKREHQNGMYRVDVYFICKTLAETPTFIALPVLFVTICYWMVGMYASFEAFVIALVTVILVTNVSTSFGYFISTMTSSITVALALAPPFIIPLMLFGGFFLNNASVPIYFIWLQYLSWFKYANEILVVNQWTNVDKLICDSAFNNTTSKISSFNSTYNESDADSTSGVRCYNDGPDVIQSLSFSESNYALDFSVLVLMLVVFRVLSFLFLLARSSSK